jgi:site-specific DNA recombinase
VHEYYGYIRVSTTRQGKEGVSLEEQKAAVERCAQNKGVALSRIFEDQITAAKQGRPAFNQMLKLLKARKARGVIIHKIDRSARNHRDWADIGDLVDTGIEVHFANESLDMTSRGGRLSADIQAVVAADFIRNLREETKKGFYGRLKQGLLPMPAPLGYLNVGKGKLKVIDPAKAPLVKKAFELYATRKFNLKQLNRELYRMGLRSKKGKRLSLNALSLLMNNPFYMGVIRIKKTSETFEGKHRALIKPELFQMCQDILQGRTNTRTKKHRLMFRRVFTCLECGRTLIGEAHSSFVYYRCQNQECAMTTIRQELLEQGFMVELDRIKLSDKESRFFSDKIQALKANWINERLATISLLEGKIKELTQRLGKLTDAFIDSTIEKEIYEERKTAILIERKSLEGKIAELNNGRSIPDEIQEFLEFTKDPKTLYETAFPDKKRSMVQVLTSKNLANKKSLVFGFRTPFDIMRNREKTQYGSPSSDVHRKLEELWMKILEAFKTFEWPEI